MIVTVVAATGISTCLTAMLHFGTLSILPQDGSRTLSTTTGGGHTAQPAPCIRCCMELCSPTSLWTSFFISAQHYILIWHSSCYLSRTFNSCTLPSTLELVDVELYSSTLLKPQTVKLWSILPQGVFYWLEWDDQSQKLVRLFWHSRQFANMNSPILSLYATRSAYVILLSVCENRQAGKIIVKKFLEARSCSRVTSTALKLDDKRQTHQSLQRKFSWRESERAIPWKSAGVCQ